MTIQLSPGVQIQERDLSSIIPAVATTTAGIAGHFRWGPADQRITVDSESNLAQLFGPPNDETATSYFSASNFLQYGNNLQVVRVVGPESYNAGAGSTTNPSILIKNTDDWASKVGYTGGYSTLTSAYWVAKYPGIMGNGLIVCACDTTGGFAAWAANGITLSSEFSRAPSTSSYVEQVSGLTQANDEIHIAVIDRDGNFSGYKNAVVEVFEGLSKATDAKNADGSSNYYAKVINDNSKYVRWTNHLPGITPKRGNEASGSNAFGKISNFTTGYTGTYFGTTGCASFACTGSVVNVPTNGQIATAIGASSGYGLFSDADFVDVSLLIGGALSGPEAAAVANIARNRRDCVAFFSAPNSNPLENSSTKTSNCTALKDAIGNNSFAVIDSGYKLQYDRWNDVDRWIPLNADTAGLCVRTDFTNDPWWSPAGLNRGQINGVIKLAFNPSKTERDIIYSYGINPVVTLPGQGTVLFGDKTAQSKPSAFDRINVRRLFIVLEKAVAIAAKYQLFEFNDAFTRSTFVSMIEPYLRDVQARRGVYDFKVICDETNNTSQIIDSNQFVADIYIKPAKSINFIQLTFVATRSGVSFEEIASLNQPGFKTTS
jgi:hypothetical protein